MAASGDQRRLVVEPKARLGAPSYLAAYMLGLVSHIGDSGVAGNQLRSSRRPDFLVVLVRFVACSNLLFLGSFRRFWRSHYRRRLVCGQETAVYLYSCKLQMRFNQSDLASYSARP